MNSLLIRANPRNPRFKFLTFGIVSVALGFVLLAAALLKTYALSIGPVNGAGFLDSRLSQIGIVQLELMLGVWLISGAWPRVARRAAIFCFALFFCAALWMALTGKTSCGCFGSVKVNPWFTAAFDLAAVGALLTSRPIGTSMTNAIQCSSPRWAAAAGSALILCITSGVLMARYEPAKLNETGDLPVAGSLVLIEPQGWNGKRFPLLEHIDVGEQLASGKWLVVLHHHDCSTCERAVPRYEELAHTTAGQADVPRIALIEMPPYGRSDDGHDTAASSCVRGRLTDRREWFATTPLVVSLQDGMVVNSAEGDAAVEPPPLAGIDPWDLRTPLAPVPQAP